eukprot:13812771-Ditylum_brightwellii.AAC.1
MSLLLANLKNERLLPNPKRSTVYNHIESNKARLVASLPPPSTPAHTRGITAKTAAETPATAAATAAATAPATVTPDDPPRNVGGHPKGRTKAYYRQREVDHEAATQWA